LSVDSEIFAPSEFGTLSPYSNIVDLAKYKNLPKQAKDILYRPPKVKVLSEKYWQLAKIMTGKEKVENDVRYYKDLMPRYPKKTTEEI
jgi:hypothetical protein